MNFVARDDFLQKYQKEKETLVMSPRNIVLNHPSHVYVCVIQQEEKNI